MKSRPLFPVLFALAFSPNTSWGARFARGPERAVLMARCEAVLGPPQGVRRSTQVLLIHPAHQREFKLEHPLILEAERFDFQGDKVMVVKTLPQLGPELLDADLAVPLAELEFLVLTPKEHGRLQAGKKFAAFGFVQPSHRFDEGREAVTPATGAPGTVLRIGQNFYVVRARAIVEDVDDWSRMYFTRLDLMKFKARPEQGHRSSESSELLIQLLQDFKLDGKVVYDVERLGRGVLALSEIIGGELPFEGEAIFGGWTQEVPENKHLVKTVEFSGFRKAESSLHSPR